MGSEIATCPGSSHRLLSDDAVTELVLQQLFTASDEIGASTAIQSAFGVGEVTVASLGTLEYRQRSLVDDGITVTDIRSDGALLHLDAGPSPDMVVISVRSGYTVLEQGPEVIALQAGDLGIVPLERAARASWERVDMDLYSFPRSSLSRLLGSELDELRLRVARLKATSSTVIEVWTRAARTLSEEVLQRRELFESDVVREQAIDTLLGLTIEAFGISDAAEDTVTASSGELQRAIAYMQSNLNRPISVSDVARAAGLSLRGLQLAFHRAGHSTPLAHLRNLRMSIAHDALETGSADPAPVARQVGYTNVGRFSAHYYDAHHESPNETIRNRGA